MGKNSGIGLSAAQTGIGGGVGGGAGFQLFTQSDNNAGIYADAAARDVYFGANPGDLTRLDENEFLIIKLLDDGGGNVAYQQRQASNWVDVTSLVQGEQGAAGATGNSYFFASIADRDAFFNTPGNEALLFVDLPIIVNIGNSTTSSLVWTGVTSPVSYDPDNWRVAAVEVSSGTLFLGEGGANISSGNDVLNFASAGAVKHFLHGVAYDDAGSEAPSTWLLDAKATVPLADVFDTTLSDPEEVALTNATNAYIDEYTLIPATTGELRLQTWLGTDDTGASLVDTSYTVTGGDIDVETSFIVPNDTLILIGEQTFTRFSGIQLKGGVQTSGPFTGQTVPFISVDVWNATSLDYAIFAGNHTEGSVLFIDADGRVAEDNTALFWNAAGKRLGIGTDSPTSLLDLRGSDGTLAIRAESGASAKILLEEENGITRLDIAYVDSSGNTNISAMGAPLIIQTNAGNLTIQGTGGEVTVRATTGALNLSAEGTSEDVNIDSASGGVEITSAGTKSIVFNNYVTVDVTGQTLDVVSVDASGAPAITISDNTATARITLQHDDSADTNRLTTVGDLTINPGSADIILDSNKVQIVGTGAGYAIEQLGDDLHISGQNGDGIIELFTATGDGTDTASLAMFDVGVGSNKVNSERLELVSNLGEWLIRMRATGTGQQRDLKIGSTAGDPVNFVALASGGTAIASESGENIDINSANDLTLVSTLKTIILDANATTGQQAGLVIEQAGSGDAVLHFDVTGVQDWTMGIDNDIGDQFAIRPAASLNAAAPLQISVDGEIGINKTPRANHCLDIDTTVNTVVALYDQKDVTFEQGNSANGNSTDFFFNRADVGFNQSEFWIYNDNNNIEADRFFKMNYTDAGTSGGLSIAFNGFIGMGVDVQPDSQLHVLADTADTVAIVTTESTGTNAGTVQKFVGDQDPNGVITGAGGAEYYRDSGATSGSYESLEAATGTNWLKRSLNPSTIIEIHNSAQFEELASGGIITISTDTTLMLKNTSPITTPSVFIATAKLTIAGTNSIEANQITYSGTGTFVTSTSNFSLVQRADLTASSTGTLVSIVGSGGFTGILFIDNSTITGWSDLGSVTNGLAFLNNTGFVSYSAPLTLTDTSLESTGLTPVASTVLIEFKHQTGGSSGNVNVVRVSPVFLFGAPFRVDPFIRDSLVIQFSNVSTGSQSVPLFDITGGTTGSFTAVADNSTGATAITSVTDNAGVAVFNAAPIPLIGETVAISTFVTNTTYNGTFEVSATGPGVFQVKSAGVEVAFGSDETGSWLANSITVTATAHGLSLDDTLQLDGDTSTEYDGGSKIFNVLVNSFDVNATFGATQAGTWDTAGLDQKNSQVLSFQSLEGDNSHYIATAFVNNNATANGAIVNNTFTNMVFGTGGSALIEGTTIERWKLINELDGTFEYTGEEPFDGLITFDFTVVSSGGTTDFRFKWQHDIGAGFVDLPDNVEALVAVGSDAQSVTKTFPLSAVKGDQIVPQITRNSGASTITTRYATIYATQ